MAIPTLLIYDSIDCPYAYLANYWLRQVWPAFEGRLRVEWRALSLEYVNRRPVTKPLIDVERLAFAQVEPALPMHPWPRAEWEWPVTVWPAFEALACAQAQGAGWAMSWALRYAFYAAGRSLSLRHELLAIAEEVAAETPLDLARFEQDWDTGRYKRDVIADSRRGWHELGLQGSATFVLPDGRRLTNPGLGRLDLDEAAYRFGGYTPPERDPLDVYRELLAAVVL